MEYLVGKNNNMHGERMQKCTLSASNACETVPGSAEAPVERLRQVT